MTQALEQLYRQINQFLPVVTSRLDTSTNFAAEIELIAKEMAKLQELQKQLARGAALEAQSQEEAFWNTPSKRRALAKRL